MPLSGLNTAVQRNRRHNAGAGSMLLLTPAAALRNIAHRAGKESRLLCTALRDVYGTPGRGISIPGQWDTACHAILLRNVMKELASWPQPEAVTKLHSGLSHVAEGDVHQNIASRLPNLLELTMGWLTESVEPFARLGITRLTAQVHSVSGLQCLTGLQALSLSSCNRRGYFGDLSPLTRLASLTSLTLAGEKKNKVGSLEHQFPGNADFFVTSSEDDSESDDSSFVRDDPNGKHGLGMWHVLAALPKLARLSLSISACYYSAPPSEPFKLSPATHLSLSCSGMALAHSDQQPAQASASVVQVLGLFPALASLKLRVMDRLIPRPPASSWESMSQALRWLELRNLEVDVFWGASLRVHIAHVHITPSLTSFACGSPVRTTAEGFHRLFPQPVAILSLSVCLDFRGDHQSKARAFQVFTERLAPITSLHVDYSMRDGSWQDAGEEASPPLTPLSSLSNLQQQKLSSSISIHCMAASLPCLPALTRLELPDGLPPIHGTVLAVLTRLRHLQLGNMKMHEDAAEMVCCLEAVQHMRGLRELVLDRVPHVGEGVLAKMLPVPPMLQRVVVYSIPAYRAALKVLGHCVDCIVLRQP